MQGIRYPEGGIRGYVFNKSESKIVSVHQLFDQIRKLNRAGIGFADEEWRKDLDYYGEMRTARRCGGSCALRLPSPSIGPRPSRTGCP
jgi:hypothetical protein